MGTLSLVVELTNKQSNCVVKRLLATIVKVEIKMKEVIKVSISKIFDNDRGENRLATSRNSV